LILKRRGGLVWVFFGEVVFCFGDFGWGSFFFLVGFFFLGSLVFFVFGFDFGGAQGGDFFELGEGAGKGFW
jgi:hypothetical protein